MSIKIMSWVWENGPKSQGELMVLLALADWADDAGKSWPSMEGIAEKARLSDQRSARRIIRRLEQDGWVKIDAGGGRHGCNRYTINTDLRSPRMHPENPDLRSPDLKSPGPSMPETRTLDAENPDRGTPRTVKNHQEPSVLRDEGKTKPEDERDRFEEFWATYPHRNGTKKGKKPAQAKWAAARKRGVSQQTMIDGAKAAKDLPDVKRGFSRDPVTWINQEGWADEFGPPLSAPTFHFERYAARKSA